MSIEHPNKIQLLYNCRITETDEKVYKVPNTAYQSINIDPKHVVEHQCENIIKIEMPFTEYERFRQNWDHYMDICQVGMTNPIIREEYHKLLVLVQLYK